MSLPLPPQFPKVCRCGCSYTAPLWATLRFVGIHSDEYECLEMRDCLCKSTLSVIVERFKEDEEAPRPLVLEAA